MDHVTYDLNNYLNNQDRYEELSEVAIADIKDRILIGEYDEYIFDNVLNAHNIDLSEGAEEPAIQAWREHYADDLAEYLVSDCIVNVWDYA